MELAHLVRLEHKAKGFSFLPRQPVHSLLTGRHASRVRGRGLEFEEIRRYLPGDDPRTIDWKISQRTRKTQVRVYTEERDRPALLIVDQRQNMFFGTRCAMKSFVAAELAAVAAWRVFHQGDRVGGIVFDDTEMRETRSHRSRRRVLQLLHDVVEMNHALCVDRDGSDSPEMLNDVLERVERTAKHDVLICVISDFYGADERTERTLARLGRHNDVICCLLFDPIKVDLPKAGRLVVTQGELQLELDTSRGRLRRDLVSFFDAELKGIQGRLQRIGVPTLMIQTAEDPLDQVRMQLGHVAARRRSGGALYLASFGNPWMANLREISTPEAISFVPSGLGWILLAALLLLAVTWVGWGIWRSWRYNAYRREALAQLRAIENDESVPPADRLSGIASVLKRVALVSFPRKQVAPLSGERWLVFLDRTLGGREFREGAGRVLAGGQYDPRLAGRFEGEQLLELLQLARRWIRHHRARPHVVAPNEGG